MAAGSVAPQQGPTVALLHAFICTGAAASGCAPPSTAPRFRRSKAPLRFILAVRLCGQRNAQLRRRKMLGPRRAGLPPASPSSSLSDAGSWAQHPIAVPWNLSMGCACMGCLSSCSCHARWTGGESCAPGLARWAQLSGHSLACAPGPGPGPGPHCLASALSCSADEGCG